MIEISVEYLASQGLSKTFPERFWNKVKKTESCWIWVAGKSMGYGSIVCGKSPKRAIRSHVASWILHFGPVPKGLCVLHDCPVVDEKSCVNPSHLYLGTDADNGRDRAIKHQAVFGEKCPRSKLSYKDVIEIRHLGGTHRALAKKYGVSHSAIGRVLKFESWRHV